MNSADQHIKAIVHPEVRWQRFLSPRYWLMWLLFGLLRASIYLPFNWLMRIGEWLGLLMYKVVPSRQRIASINLTLCFPELSPSEHDKRLSASARHTGRAVFETALAWWAGNDKLQPLVKHITGIEHVQQAMAENQSVILLSAHMTCLEMGGRLLSMQVPTAEFVYKKARNPLFDAMMWKRRRLMYSHGYERKDTRGIIRSLRAGAPLWYAPDQNFNTEDLVFAPFFGTPAATLTATAKMARLGKAIVIPYLPKRVDGGYALTFLPALTAFPSGDDLADATRVNQVVEQAILEAPEQYMWVHKRFKNRPPGEPRIY